MTSVTLRVGSSPTDTSWAKFSHFLNKEGYSVVSEREHPEHLIHYSAQSPSRANKPGKFFRLFVTQGDMTQEGTVVVTVDPSQVKYWAQVEGPVFLVVLNSTPEEGWYVLDVQRHFSSASRTGQEQGVLKLECTHQTPASFRTYVEAAHSWNGRVLSRINQEVHLLDSQCEVTAITWDGVHISPKKGSTLNMRGSLTLEQIKTLSKGSEVSLEGADFSIDSPLLMSGSPVKLAMTPEPKEVRAFLRGGGSSIPLHGTLNSILGCVTGEFRGSGFKVSLDLDKYKPALHVAFNVEEWFGLSVGNFPHPKDIEAILGAQEVVFTVLYAGREVPIKGRLALGSKYWELFFTNLEKAKVVSQELGVALYFQDSFCEDWDPLEELYQLVTVGSVPIADVGDTLTVGLVEQETPPAFDEKSILTIKGDEKYSCMGAEITLPTTLVMQGLKVMSSSTTALTLQVTEGSSVRKNYRRLQEVQA